MPPFLSSQISGELINSSPPSYKATSFTMKSGLLREVAYLEMDSLIIFYYYKASET
jgi:hypothetical protein